MSSWIKTKARLEPIDFDGESNFRFTEDLVQKILSRFTKTGDWIFDPFCGLGTTLKVAEESGRHAIGFEPDINRFNYTKNKVVTGESRVINDVAENILNHNTPQFDFVFTSPPYDSFRGWNQAGVDNYFTDLTQIFKTIKKVLKPDAKIAIHIANIREPDGTIRPLAFNVHRVLSKVFEFDGEMIDCYENDASREQIGYGHNYIMVFKNQPPQDNSDLKHIKFQE